MQTVLVIGGGGREHALAACFARSTRIGRVLVAPGNGGTATDPSGRVENRDVRADDIDGLLALACEARVDVTFVGPEVPLAAGLVDRFAAEGLRAFGPTAAAAQLESSKAFAKAFMGRWGLPCAASASFTDRAAAYAYVVEHWGPLVLKASGLAAGKGVLLPETLEEALDGLDTLLADGEVVVEERLVGEEVSLLAFCDGRTARCMPPARDHKRVWDGDRGPNTGGMGAFAPSTALDDDAVTRLEQDVLARAVEGMAAEGHPFVGVLYAGLMLTADGPKLLEFNCRFGDPETQVLLPLLETDLLDVVEACLDGRLADLDLRWSDRVAATVVLASAGYPGSYRRGLPIAGLPCDLPDATVFHAGTRWTGETWQTDGGRVLCVTGTGDDLPAALAHAYTAAETIHFEGRHLRRDIGRMA